MSCERTEITVYVYGVFTASPCKMCFRCHQ